MILFHNSLTKTTPFDQRLKCPISSLIPTPPWPAWTLTTKSVNKKHVVTSGVDWLEFWLVRVPLRKLDRDRFGSKVKFYFPKRCHLNKKWLWNFIKYRWDPKVLDLTRRHSQSLHWPQVFVVSCKKFEFI